MTLEIPPLPSLKTNVCFENLYTVESCAVAVVYCIYDRKRKTIVSMGTSRACGENHNQDSRFEKNVQSTNQNSKHVEQ